MYFTELLPLQESTPLATPEAPPVIPTEDHATDEEKLASSVTNQKPWTYQGVANELAEDPQDYPQPSDLSAFVNDNNFNSPTKGKEKKHPELLNTQ